MTVSQKQAIQQAELHSQLWNMANALRGNMDASEFKNYILGLIFYRYLSENLEFYVNGAILNEDKILMRMRGKKRGL
jgi:type I restriction enzyme M protein